MKCRVNRRDFLATSAAAGAGLVLASRLQADPWKTTLHKAMIGLPTEQILSSWKAAGFEGIEVVKGQKLSPQETAAARKTAESLGMRIHSVLFGWGSLNGGDAAMAKTVADMEATLQMAQGYGAETVLFVPCRIDATPMPEPWEFDIRFDEKTGYLKQVVAGDNAKYQAYIAAHNHAVDTTREGVKRLIPTAEKAGVIIALENVWNNLWVKPDFAAKLRRLVQQSLGEGLLRHRQSRQVRRAARLDPHDGQADREVPRQGFQAQSRRPRRTFLQHPRRQRQLAGGAQGPRRRRLQWLGEYRRRRFVGPGARQTFGPDRRRQVTIPEDLFSPVEKSRRTVSWVGQYIWAWFARA